MTKHVDDKKKKKLDTTSQPPEAVEIRRVPGVYGCIDFICIAVGRITARYSFSLKFVYFFFCSRRDRIVIRTACESRLCISDETGRLAWDLHLHGR